MITYTTALYRKVVAQGIVGGSPGIEPSDPEIDAEMVQPDWQVPTNAKKRNRNVKSVEPMPAPMVQPFQR